MTQYTIPSANTESVCSPRPLTGSLHMKVHGIRVGMKGS